MKPFELTRRGFAFLGLGAPAAAVAVYLPNPAQRLSTDSADPGYRAWLELVNRGVYPKIRLDGIEQPFVMTVDAGLGYVVRCILNSEGHIFCIEHDGHCLDHIAMEVAYGKVEIDLKISA